MSIKRVTRVNAETGETETLFKLNKKTPMFDSWELTATGLELFLGAAVVAVETDEKRVYKILDMLEGLHA